MPPISGQLSALTLPGRRALWTTKPRTSANHRETGHTRADTCRSRSPARFRVRAIRRPSRRSRSKRPFAVRSRRSRSKRPFAPLALKPKQIALQLILEGRHFGFAALAPAGLVEGVPEVVEGADLDEEPFVGLQGRSEKIARFARYARSYGLPALSEAATASWRSLRRNTAHRTLKKALQRKVPGKPKTKVEVTGDGRVVVAGGRAQVDR